MSSAAEIIIVENEKQELKTYFFGGNSQKPLYYSCLSTPLCLGY